MAGKRERIARTGMKRGHSSTPSPPRKYRSVADISDAPLRFRVQDLTLAVSQGASEGSPARGGRYTRGTCHGTSRRSQRGRQVAAVQRNLDECSSSLETMSQPSRDGSRSPSPLLGVPRCLSGRTLSRGNQSTSTSCSVHSTMLHQSKSMLDAWDQLRSALDAQNLQDAYTLVESGPRFGTQLSRPRLVCMSELREYGDYMNREFSSKIVEAHRKVIYYDAAVRAEVGGGQNVYSLTGRMYSAIVMPDGIESRYGQAASSIGGRSQPDFCRRSNSSSTCRYRHVCSRCKQRGYGQFD